jgi:cholesterol transport system auxiliary component
MASPSNSTLRMATATASPLSRRSLGAALLGTTVLAAAGCGINAPPARKLVLTPVASFPGGVRRVTWSLVVDEPGAGRQLDTSQIAVMDGAYRIEYYKEAEWADAAPAMIRDLLIQSFRNTGALPVVGSTRLGLYADVMLVSTLTKFQVEPGPGNAPQAAVAIETTLLQLPRRNPIATARFEKAIPIGEVVLEYVGSAFNESLGDVMRRIVVWTLENGRAVASG